MNYNFTTTFYDKFLDIIESGLHNIRMKLNTKLYDSSSYFLTFIKSKKKYKETFSDMIDDYIQSLRFCVQDRDIQWATKNSYYIELAKTESPDFVNNKTQIIVNAKCLFFQDLIKKNFSLIVKILAIDYILSVIWPKIKPQNNLNINKNYILEFEKNLDFVNLDSDLYTIYSICDTFYRLMLKQKNSN